MSETGANPAALGDEELRRLDAYWRAANFLSVGQIYLLDNPLLREALTPEHIKPRLLGHFGTAPGLNLVYAHMNRAIRARDLEAMYVIGPGHGGPAIVANAWLGMPPGNENCRNRLRNPSSSSEISGYTSAYVPSR